METASKNKTNNISKAGRRAGVILSVIACFVILIICIRAGSVYISLKDLASVIGSHITGNPLPGDVSPMLDSIFWEIRMPRAIVAFLVGGSLAVSGAVMQALLQNPIASSYTMGVSSGACLGAALVLVSGISIPFAMSGAGFVTGLIAVIAVLLFASAIDRMSSNATVVLIGMVFSLFVTGIMNLLATLYSDHAKRLWLWMLGSFSARNWTHAAIILPVAVIGTVIIVFYSRELDIMTFGEEQSKAMGVETRKVKTVLIILSSVLTGVSVSLAGVIGFVDLVAPHVVRKLFGPEHKTLIPLSFLYGGAFMALSDLVARTILSPQEIPIGAVTALAGAPFFAYVFFAGRKKG